MRKCEKSMREQTKKGQNNINNYEKNLLILDESIFLNILK